MKKETELKLLLNANETPQKKVHQRFAKRTKRQQTFSMMNILAQVFRAILDHHLHTQPSQTPLSLQLKASGIPQELVQRALQWLEKFFAYDPVFYDTLNHGLTQESMTYRLYASQETERLGIGGQEYLTDLTLKRVLSPGKREFLIDCIMSEDITQLTLQQLRFLTFMVLAQDCKKPEEIDWLKQIVLKPESELTTLAN
jgi:Smg protein